MRIIHKSIFIKVSFQQIRIWVGRSKVQISALARLFSNPISIKIYPSSYDLNLNTGYQFMWDMTCLTVHLLSCEECNMRSICKRSTRVVANYNIVVLSFVASSTQWRLHVYVQSPLYHFPEKIPVDVSAMKLLSRQIWSYELHHSDEKGHLLSLESEYGVHLLKGSSIRHSKQYFSPFC